MNCVIYARVSTEKQADLSIPAQLQAMRDYAHQRQWLVAEEFVEPGASAKTTDRPALQRLLARVRDTKRRTHVVLVHKIDRLARNVYDHATIKALLKQHSVQLASVVENVDDTVPGQLVENIMASIAQFYSANLAEEVKKGMRQKILRGGWPHLPPRGYVSVKNADGRGSHVEVHPRLGPLVTRAFELYATGNYSLRGLAQRLASEGLVTKPGHPLPQSNIRLLLTNPFYIGRVVWKGLDLPGEHPALTTPEIFNRVQKLVEQRYRHVGIKGTVPGFPLRGVAMCASCRGRMTAERHGRWGYYRCSRQTYKKERCSARFSSATQAHVDLKRLCNRVQISRGTAEAIRDAAAQLIAQRVVSHDDRISALRDEHSRLLTQETQLTDAFSAGDVSPEAYKETTAGLRHRRAEIEERIDRPPVAEEDLKASVRRTLDLATSLWDLYEPLDDARRTELLRAVFRTIVLGPEGIVGFSLNSPFDMLQKQADTKKQAVALVDLLNAA